MTRKEALKWLRTFRGRYGINELEDAVEMAIKALESKDVLDKITAEINECKSTIDNAISEDELKIKGIKEAYEDCLEIIDKYKAESEE